MALPPHIPGTFGHGEWTLFKAHWSQPWQAYNHTTGETIDTGENHVERAKDTLPAPPKPEPTGGRYTIMPRRTTVTPRGWDVA